MDSHLPRGPWSRRAFFRGAGVVVAGGSATFVAACGGGAQNAGSGDAAQNADTENADVEILNSALDLEHMAVAAYTAGTPLLRGERAEGGDQRFLAQEREHADALTQAIRSKRGEPNRPRSSYDFPRLASQAGVLRFAVDLENTAVAAYIDALPKLTDPDLRATAAAIVTNEAQHIAILLGAQGRPQVPDAFVKGQA